INAGSPKTHRYDLNTRQETEHRRNCEKRSSRTIPSAYTAAHRLLSLSSLGGVMSRGRYPSSVSFFLTIAIAAALTAFLTAAGADDFAEPGASAVLKAADDVTSSAKAEHASTSDVQFKVSYKREGEAHSRVFLVPRELASELDGGLSGALEVKSLVLA